MGHGDLLCIADANFPSDSVASKCIVNTPIRVYGSTSDLLLDILTLLPVDKYDNRLYLMDRVPSDKQKHLHVPAYDSFNDIAQSKEIEDIVKIERADFYDMAKKCFCIIQTTDTTPYANVIISKGVI
jgi:L-fucose mutarotase